MFLLLAATHWVEFDGYSAIESVDLFLFYVTDRFGGRNKKNK